MGGFRLSGPLGAFQAVPHVSIDSGTLNVGPTPPPVILGTPEHPASHGGHHGGHHRHQLDLMLRLFAHRAVSLAKSRRLIDRTIKLHAKVDVLNVEGKVAQAYFATDSSTLTQADKQALMAVYNAYAHVLAGDRLLARRVSMRFVGYADHRGTERHNEPLRLRRAQAVAYCFAALRVEDGYDYKIEEGGPEEPQPGTTGRELVAFRRVDVFAYPALAKPPPKSLPPVAESVLATSRRWKFRFRSNVIAPGIWKLLGSAEAGVSAMFIEICDFDNNIAMLFSYVGGGASVGLGASASSEWEQFESSQPLNILDLIGPVGHIGGALQVAWGPAADGMVLVGPAVKRQADAIWISSSELAGHGVTLNERPKSLHELREVRFHVAAGIDVGYLAPLSQIRKVDEGYAGEWEEEASAATKMRSLVRKIGFYISLLR